MSCSLKKRRGLGSLLPNEMANTAPRERERSSLFYDCRVVVIFVVAHTENHGHADEDSSLHPFSDRHRCNEI